MAIQMAVQRGIFVYIYNESNSMCGTVHAGTGPNDGLQGYTSSTVNVRRGSFIYCYNEKGHMISTRSAV